MMIVRISDFFFCQGPASWEVLTSYTCRLILKPMRPEPSLFVGETFVKPTHPIFFSSFFWEVKKEHVTRPLWRLAFWLSNLESM